MSEWRNEDNDLQVYESQTGKNKIKEAGETAAGAGCFVLGCLGQTALSGVFLVIQLMVGLFVLGLIARMFGCD